MVVLVGGVKAVVIVIVSAYHMTSRRVNASMASIKANGVFLSFGAATRTRHRTTEQQFVGSIIDYCLTTKYDTISPRTNDIGSIISHGAQRMRLARLFQGCREAPGVSNLHQARDAPDLFLQPGMLQGQLEIS